MTRREPAARIRLIEADKSDSATLLRFYQEILVPNFRPDQMFAEDVFMVAQRSEALRTVLSWDDENNLVGGLTGHWYATCRVFLLDYLVVSSEFRGGGVGSALLNHGLERWSSAQHTNAAGSEPSWQPSAKPGQPRQWRGAHGCVRSQLGGACLRSITIRSSRLKQGVSMAIGEDLNSQPSAQKGQRSFWTTFSVAATAIAAVITALATLLGALFVFFQGKNDPGTGPIPQEPGPVQVTPPPSFPISRAIACRPPMPRSQDARVHSEVRNLIEATYHICVNHPDGKFDPPEAVTTVTSFVPAGEGTVIYRVKGNTTGYVKLEIDGPSDTTGRWSASWQQNSSNDCWSQLIVTGPDGLQRENSTYTDCHPLVSLDGFAQRRS